MHKICTKAQTIQSIFKVFEETFPTPNQKSEIALMLGA